MILIFFNRGCNSGFFFTIEKEFQKFHILEKKRPQEMRCMQTKAQRAPQRASQEEKKFKNYDIN